MMSDNRETQSKDLPAALLSFDLEGLQVHPEVQALHRGASCPQCQVGRLDYDGLLNLVCPRCGYTAGGCFT